MDRGSDSVDSNIIGVDITTASKAQLNFGIRFIMVGIFEKHCLYSLQNLLIKSELPMGHLGMVHSQCVTLNFHLCLLKECIKSAREVVYYLALNGSLSLEFQAGDKLLLKLEELEFA